MKTQLKSLIFSLFLLPALCFNAAQAQNAASSVKEALEAKQFVFDVQTVLPATGTARQVTGERYRVRVSGDSLVSVLPYFGRAYTASYGERGGIEFTSTTFDYLVKARRKGGWDVSIKPKSVADVREFLLTVSESGTATLRALSNSRQPISFYGTVHALAPATASTATQLAPDSSQH